MRYPDREDATKTIADIFAKDFPVGKVKLEILNGKFFVSMIP
jgi:hypothetical protein